MRASLRENKEVPNLFVQQLHLPSPRTAERYRSMLNGFWRFTLKETSRKPLSVEVMRRWLVNRSASRSDCYVYRCACLVDRFLDWMVATGACSANPFALLRKQYALKNTRPIVRALLSANPKQALKELRPLPRFGSFLGASMRDHIALMRAMGHRYDEARLLRFDRFLQGRPELSGQQLNTLIREWSRSGSRPSHILEAQQVGRTLAKILCRFDPSAKLFVSDRRAERLAHRAYRRPYIYTEDQIRCVLKAAREFPSPKAPLRSPTLYTMLVLAYCAGLRLGELVRLTLGDIDFRDDTIEIRGTKFFKSRRVPLAPSVISALRDYLTLRQKAGAPTDSSSPLFWHRHEAGGYARVTTHWLLVRVLRNVGLKQANGYRGPRVHDLRHTFVVHRMLAWYREGINPQPYLPYLATYLGHKDINSTLVYLTITQELLQYAGERYRRLGAIALGCVPGGGR